MQLFEGYSADELHGFVQTSRWVAGTCLVIGLVAFGFNQWVARRLADADQKERVEARLRAHRAEEELRRVKNQNTEVVHDLDKLTASRKLSPAQIESVTAALANEEKGRVVITFLTVEWDAEEVSRQFVSLLRKAGFEAVLSDYLWVDLKPDGIYLTSAATELPKAGRSIQRAFSAAGVPLPVIPPGEIARAVGAGPNDTVLVISNRN